MLKPGGRFAVSDLVLLRPLPEAVAKDINAYVGCIAGASLLSDYIRMAMEAGLDGLSIPQITASDKLAAAYGLDSSRIGGGCCGPNVIADAARAVVSVKLHGQKPE